MRGAKVLMALLAAGALAMGAGVTLAGAAEQKAPESAKTTATSKQGKKEAAVDRIVRGEVLAVETNAKTLTVKAMRGKEEETVGVEVPQTAKITQGKAVKTLADIKVGDRVWMKYDRMTNKLVADQIRILHPGKMAGKAVSKGKTS